MENLKLNIDKIFDFVAKDAVYGYKDEAMRNINALYNKTAKGNDFLGWVKLPSAITDAQLKEVETVAASFKNKIDFMVVIGIGGSYLGSKAVIEALSGNFYQYEKKPENPIVIFAGQNIGEDYLFELLRLLDDKSYAVTVISKSGTTTEPAIAFRLLKNHLEKKYGKAEATTRIIAVTDEKKGALRKLATQEGYKTFVIPDDVGGRYSVLTPVGLIAIAVAGFDIRQLVKGANDMQTISGEGSKFEENPAAIYAAARNALLKKGKVIEILANYDSRLNYMSEWWKQLYGESEGKENKGIFPASVNFTADLHSMGQFIQEGSRNLFETVISVKEPQFKLTIPSETVNLDDLNYIAGKRIDGVNKMAELGVRIAHVDGGVPNILVEIPKINEYYIGQLIYFFEIACGISGYMLGVNPFDQPGVEAYKKNMFALLEKPGFEEESKKIKARLK